MNDADDSFRGRTGGSPADPPARPVRRVPLTQIIGGDREVQIDHDGQIYRLRVTGKGKLILTK